MRRLSLIAALFVFALWCVAGDIDSPGRCPVCGTVGVTLIAPNQLAHCECEKWWPGKTVIRLAVGDCSDGTCPESNGPKLRYLDMPVWRCPKDGLLFTEPMP